MKIFYTAILLIFSVLSCTNSSSTDSETTEFVNIEHGIVFHQDGKYGGWPANNGIWIWDNEILVGFVEADYKSTDGLHTYDVASARHKYARSKDGGKTWAYEDAYALGQTARGNDHNLEEEKAVEPVKMEKSIENFVNQEFMLIA